MSSISPARAQFQRLHESGCFLLPNPWDRGSARYLASLGFPALASSSAAMAFSLGLPDTPAALSLEQVLEHLRELVADTPLPVNADFQAGYGDSPDEVAKSVARCVETGVAGLSIEDVAPGGGLIDPSAALERVIAAKEAIGNSGVVLTARAECFLVQAEPSLDETLERLQAYRNAGAECLYAPGVKQPEHLRAVLDAAGDVAVNVLAADPLKMTHASLAGLGVRRISVGSALNRVAWSAWMHAAKAMVQEGSFAPLADATPFGTLNELFSS